MVLGWIRPAIVLPAAEEDAAPRPGSQVDAVLLHELAHLRRGDDLWNLVQQVVQILYWPHPLTWLAARMIAGVREQACDDLCVRMVGGADDYRTALVAVASRLVRGPIASIPDVAGTGDGPRIFLGTPPSPVLDRPDARRIGLLTPLAGPARDRLGRARRDVR